MDGNRILRTGGAGAWLLILLAMLTPGPARAGFFSPFFESAFSFPDSIAQWSITAGNWQFANDEFLSRSTGTLSIATVPTYDPPNIPFDTIGGDLSLEVYLSIGSNAAGARAGAAFEFADANNFHEVTLSATGNVQLRSRLAGVSRIVATATTTAPGGNKWVHLALVRASGRTTVRIDGVRVFDNVLQDGLQPGDVGLLTRNTSARFDDLDARSFGRQNDPYMEDFNDGVASGWQPLSGQWSAASKVYINSAVIQTAITQGPLVDLFDAGGAPFDLPYTFKVRMLNPYGGSGNLVGLAWVSGPDDYAEAVFSPKGEAALNLVRNGVRSTIASAQYAGAGPNKWFEVEVENDGGQPQQVTRIKVNGVPVFETAPNVRDGELSFITHWAPGRFDDVRAAARFFRPFSADFDDPSPPPQIVRGTWRLADGMLTSSTIGQSERAVITDGAGWHDLADIELRARMVNRFANSGNLVGFTYGEHAQVFYEASFSPTGVAHLRKVVRGVPFTIATAPYSGGAQRESFDAQLILIGERTTVKVNGVPVFENVLQPEAVGGSLGFVTHWTNASIDDVSLVQIPATRYRVTPLENLANPFGSLSFVQALNDRAEAVGRSRSATGSQIAVLWRNGRLLVLGASNSSEAAGINNKSEVVGTGSGKAFLWKNGVLRELNAPPEMALLGTAAVDINEHSEIAVSSCRALGDCPALLWEPNGTIVPLEDTPSGPVSSEVFAINDAGQVVGQRGGSGALWQDGTVELIEGITPIDINNRRQIVGIGFAGPPNFQKQRGLIWQDGELSALPVLPALVESQAHGINDHGVAVGWNTRPGTTIDQGAHAVIWQDGGVLDLNDRIACGTLPEAILLTRAEDINERGQMAVDGIDKSAELPSSQRAFVLTPVSAQEPCN